MSSKKYMKNIAACFASLLMILSGTEFAFAETRYIDDTLYAPLRSGEGLGFRIVHKGVKSGTALELIGSNSESGYSKVRTPEGIVGWLPTRYLVRQPIARIKLEQLTKEHDVLKEKFKEVSEERSNLRTTNDAIAEKNRELTDSNKRLQEELAEIKRISTNAITLDQRNRELRTINEQQNTELDARKAEIDLLKGNNERDKMLLGGGLVLLGVLIAVIVPMFKRDKRNSW